MEAAIKAITDLLSAFGVVGSIALPFVLLWLWINRRIFYPKEGASEELKARLANDLQVRRHWIEDRTIEQRYFRLLDWLLGGIARRLTQDAESLNASRDSRSWPVRLFSVNPFTEGSYLLCLRLALVYPLLGVLMVWFLGEEGALSKMMLFPFVEAGGKRILLASFFGFVAFIYFRSKSIEDWGFWVYFPDAVAHAVLVISVVAFIFALAVALGSTGPVAFSFFVTVIVASSPMFEEPPSFTFIAGFNVACAVAFSGAVANFLPLAVIVFVIVAVAIVVKFVCDEHFGFQRSVTLYWIGLNIFYVSFVVLVLAWALPRAKYSEQLLIAIFLVLLPLANAALDWLSLAFTRGFLYAIGRRHHAGLVALGFAGFDIALALAFLFSIASLTTLLLSTVNAATVAWGGVPLLDMAQLFDGLALDPGALEFSWIHFMMLSTLIPTLLHFFVAGFAVVLIMPERLRQWILANWDSSEDARHWAFWWTSLAPVVALAAPALLLWGLYELLTAWGGTVGHHLLVWVHAIALAVDPCFTTPLP